MDGWRLITHQFSSKACIRCSRPDWGPALPYCSRNQNQGTFLPCRGFSTLLHGQCVVGSALREVSIAPLQVPGVCQEHSDGFFAAAVGFGTGQHKLDTEYESPSGPAWCRGKGLSPGSATAQDEKSSHRVPRRQNPAHPREKPCPWQQEETQLPHRARGLWLVAWPCQGAGGGKQGWQKQRAALSEIHPE